MLLTIIFDFRVIKLRNYPKISHLGHVNEILMQNPACAVLRWRLIRGEQKIVWLYKQLVYCPGHSVITISQQWCDCTRLWSEGRRGEGDTWQYLTLFVYYLYIAFVFSCAWYNSQPPAAAGRMKVGGKTKTLTWLCHMPLVLCRVFRLQWILGWEFLFWSGWAPAPCVQLQRQWQSHVAC